MKLIKPHPHLLFLYTKELSEISRGFKEYGERAAFFAKEIASPNRTADASRILCCEGHIQLILSSLGEWFDDYDDDEYFLRPRSKASDGHCS